MFDPLREIMATKCGRPRLETLHAHPHYIAAINRVLDWIETHLAEDVSLQKLADVAGFSSFHFHRLFVASTGETVHALVMRLREARALALIRHAPFKSLTSIALESGFGSSSNLARTFARRYNVKPSALRSREAWTSFLMQRRPEASISSAQSQAPASVLTAPRIEQWPALPLAYVRVFAAYLNPGALVAAYRQIEDWADARAIERGQSRLIGMSIDDPAVVPLAKCRYDFCRETTVREKASAGIHHRILPASRWAVLPCQGDLEQVDQSWRYLFAEWLPRSGWQPANLPALEVFHRRPEEIGWQNFDLDCCLPIEPLVR